MAGVTEATAEKRFVQALRECDEDAAAAVLSEHPELVETAPDEWYFNHPMAVVGSVEWGTPPVSADRTYRARRFFPPPCSPVSRANCHALPTCRACWWR